MIDDFLKYKEALKLKELGFKELCYGYFAPNTSANDDLTGADRPFAYVLYAPYKFDPKKDSYDVAAPTFRQAFKWFRDIHKLHVETPFVVSKQRYIASITEVKELHSQTFFNGNHINHEDAELACLKKLIEIISK